jgi:hypothetical protein
MASRMKTNRTFTTIAPALGLLPLARAKDTATAAAGQQTPSLPNADPRSDRPRSGRRESKFLAAIEMAAGRASNFRAIVACGVAILLHGTCAMRVLAAEPSKVATERSGKLKADLKTFTLSLSYNGPQDKPYYHLILSVPKPPGDDRADPFYRNVQVTEKQAEAIIDYLAMEEFFDHAREAFLRTPVPPYYMLWVEVQGKGQPARYGESLGWNLKMVQRLDGLRKVFEGDAAKAMDILIARMAGHRTEWEKQAKSAPGSPDAGVGQQSPPDLPPGVKEWPEVDTTLAYYLSRSDAVVECTIIQTDERPLADASGLARHECDVLVAKSIKGGIKPDEAIRVFVPRWKNTPGPAPGKRYILFLKQREAQHQRDRATLTDMWFGVQLYDELMASRLEILAATPKNQSDPVKPASSKE